MSNYDDDIDDLDSDEEDFQDRFSDRGHVVDVDDDDDASDDENDNGSVQGADSAVPGRGSPTAELERMLEEMDDDDPRRRSIEKEFKRVMEESIGQFGIGVFG